MPPKGADEGDPRGCARHRRADTEVGLYGVSPRLSVGADLRVRPHPPSCHCEERSDVAIRTLRPPESCPKNGIPQSASLTAPFHKGAYWCSTSAPLVKGGTPPKAEGGFRPPYLAKFYIICYNPPKRCQWR